MLRKLLSIVLYSTLFLVSTLVFTYFSFPLDQFRAYIEHKANSSSKFRLEIGSIEREGMKALILEDLSLGLNKRLFKRSTTKGKPVVDSDSKDPEEGAKGAPEPAVEEEAPTVQEEFSYIGIEYLRLEFNLFQLLGMKKVELKLDVELLGGSIEQGVITLDQEVGFSRPDIELPEIMGVNLGDTEFFAALFSAVLPSLKAEKVSGTLESGFVSLHPRVEEGAPYYEGEIEFELQDIIAIEPLLSNRLRNAGTVEVPLTDMRLGSCVFHIKMDRKDRIEALDKVRTKDTTGTVILFERGECKGESLDYFVQENSFILLPTKGSAMKGSMDLWTKLAFSPDYFDEKRVVDGEVVTKNKELGQGLEFDRQWQRSRDADGYYWMHCKGSLSKPRCSRQLPPEETRRLEQKKKVETQRKKEALPTPKLRTPNPKPQDGVLLQPDRETPDTKKKGSLFDQRREAAQKRAEQLKKRQERNLLRKEMNARKGGKPGAVKEDGEDKEEPAVGDEEYDEELPEGEYSDDEPEEGYADDELPSDEELEGGEPIDGEPVDEEAPLEGEYVDEGEVPPEGEEVPPEEGEPEMAPFP